MHVGLIGGIGPAATHVYYDAIVGSFATTGLKLELTIAHADLREMIENLEAGRAEQQAEIFARHIDQLRVAGCQAAAVTSMGGHFCINELKAVSTLPIIDAVPALDEFFSANQASCVGVLGTRTVMETKLYGVTTVDVIAPDPDQINDVHNTYLRIAASGVANEEISEFFIEAGARLCRAGAELIVLGGTDLSVAFKGRTPGYPIADTALIHAAAISQAAMGHRPTRQV